MIWLMPVLALMGGSLVVGVVARKVQREVEATSLVVHHVVDALGGVSEEADRAQEHLDHLAARRPKAGLVRRRRRRPVPSTP
jgi:hypothetical protein